MRFRCLAIFAALVLWILPAAAADGAQSRAIGYSKDGKYFAFEQYGIEDGSGFPYWEVFVLDLAANDWVKGTPVKVQLQDEEARLPEARKQAMAKAGPVLKQLAIDEPADLLLANPFTEAVPDRTRVRFGIFHTTMEPPYELSVESVDLPAPSECSDPDFKPTGMMVKLRVLTTGKELTIARDEKIPKSRQCPLRYDIEAIYTPSGYGSPAPQVALIGVYSRGFEGEDRRFIALPFELPSFEK
jgi:predicted secreted protein